MTTPLARMQYAGWVKITPSNAGTAGNPVLVPITRSTVDAHPNPIIMEDAIMGGVPGNPATSPVSPINYAQGKLAFNGEIAFPLFDDSGNANGSIIDTVLATTFSSRDYFHQIEIYDGFNYFNYQYFKVKTLTIGGQAAANGRLDCTMSIEALCRAGSANFDAGVGAVTSLYNPTISGGTSYINKRPIPFWDTTFTVHAIGGGTAIAPRMITAWQLQIDNQLYIHNAASGSRLPDDIQCGQQKVTGNFTYYPVVSWGTGTKPSVPASDPSEMVDNNAQAAPDGTSYNVLSPTDGMSAVALLGSSKTLTVPYMAFTGYPRDLTNPNQKPLRNVTFQGFGDSTHGACYSN